MEAKKKCLIVEHSLMSDYYRPRSWTEDKEFSQQTPKGKELQAKTLLIHRPPSFIDKEA